MCNKNWLTYFHSFKQTARRSTASQHQRTTRTQRNARENHRPHHAIKHRTQPRSPPTPTATTSRIAPAQRQTADGTAIVHAGRTRQHGRHTTSARLAHGVATSQRQVRRRCVWFGWSPSLSRVFFVEIDRMPHSLPPRFTPTTMLTCWIWRQRHPRLAKRCRWAFVLVPVLYCFDFMVLLSQFCFKCNTFFILIVYFCSWILAYTINYSMWSRNVCWYYYYY